MGDMAEDFAAMKAHTEDSTFMSEEQQAPDRTIDKLHRETGIPMWALEIAFELSTRGMLDEETMAGMRVIPDAARVIAESVPADSTPVAQPPRAEQCLHQCDYGEMPHCLLPKGHEGMHDYNYRPASVQPPTLQQTAEESALDALAGMGFLGDTFQTLVKRISIVVKSATVRQLEADAGVLCGWCAQGNPAQFFVEADGFKHRLHGETPWATCHANELRMAANRAKQL